MQLRTQPRINIPRSVVLIIITCLSVMTFNETKYSQTTQRITKDRLLGSLRYGKEHKEKRISAERYIQLIKDNKVDFQITADEDKKEIYEAGSYLEQKGLENLIAAINENSPLYETLDWLRQKLVNQGEIHYTCNSPSINDETYVIDHAGFNVEECYFTYWEKGNFIDHSRHAEYEPVCYVQMLLKDIDLTSIKVQKIDELPYLHAPCADCRGMMKKANENLGYTNPQIWTVTFATIAGKKAIKWTSAMDLEGVPRLQQLDFYSIRLKDKEAAEKVMRAFQQAVKLCKGKADPF